MQDTIYSDVEYVNLVRSFSYVLLKKEERTECMTYTFRIKNKRWTIKSAHQGDEHLIMNGEPCIAQLYKQLRIIYFDDGLLDDYEEMRNIGS